MQMSDIDVTVTVWLCLAVCTRGRMPSIRGARLLDCVRGVTGRSAHTPCELGAPRRERGDASRAVGPSRDTHTPHTFSVSRLSPVSCGLLPPGGSRRKGGRSGFLADLTLARRGPTTLATLVRPRSEDLFLCSENLFVRRRLRSDFSRFDPASPGDGPTLATLVRPRARRRL